MHNKLKIRMKNFSLHDSKKSGSILLKYIAYGTGLPMSVVNQENNIEQEDYYYQQKDSKYNSINSYNLTGI